MSKLWEWLDRTIPWGGISYLEILVLTIVLIALAGTLKVATDQERAKNAKIDAICKAVACEVAI